MKRRMKRKSKRMIKRMMKKRTKRMVINEMLFRSARIQTLLKSQMTKLKLLFHFQIDLFFNFNVSFSKFKFFFYFNIFPLRKIIFSNATCVLKVSLFPVFSAMNDFFSIFFCGRK